MKRPALKPHQAQAISYAEKNPYTILALDPRLGKSRCAIEIREKHKLNCLIICPSYLVDNWKKEINLWADKPKIIAVHSGKEIPAAKYLSHSHNEYIIISYSLAQKAEHLFEWAEMAVLDEAPAIKSMATKRSQFIHKNIFENSLKRVLLLTGTPIKNRVREFYSLLALTFYNPTTPQGPFLDLYPDEITFAEQFSHSKSYDVEVKPGKYITVTNWFGIKNTEELKNKWLKDRYIRIRDTDVLDMPDVSYKPVLISDIADPGLLAAFNAHFADDSYLREEAKDSGEMVKREERTGSVLPEHKAMAALKKTEFTVKYAKDLLEEVECVLIYSDHIQAAEAIAREFKVQAITGKVPAIKRAEMARRFQAGEGKVLVATIGSLKEGVDLYRANHLIFSDLCWIPGDLKQVVNRMRVVGKKHKCTAHRIYGSPQDEMIANVLDEKMATIEAAT